MRFSSCKSFNLTRIEREPTPTLSPEGPTQNCSLTCSCQIIRYMRLLVGVGGVGGGCVGCVGVVVGVGVVTQQV